VGVGVNFALSFVPSLLVSNAPFLYGIKYQIRQRDKIDKLIPSLKGM